MTSALAVEPRQQRNQINNGENQGYGNWLCAILLAIPAALAIYVGVSLLEIDSGEFFAGAIFVLLGSAACLMPLVCTVSMCLSETMDNFCSPPDEASEPAVSPDDPETAGLDATLLSKPRQ